MVLYSLEQRLEDIIVNQWDRGHGICCLPYINVNIRTEIKMAGHALPVKHETTTHHCSEVFHDMHRVHAIYAYVVNVIVPLCHVH